jgi:branched-chain amino acid transport system permease protein
MWSAHEALSGARLTGLRGRSLAAIAAFAAAYLALGLLIQNQYYQLMLTLVLVWAIMGVSWNVFSGYSGLVSFGHASFFGLGAYTVALLFVHFDITPWIGVPVGMLAGALAGVLIGYPTFRLRGVYFALAMLAYPLALLYIFEWLGYQEVPLPMKREAPAAYMQFSDYRAYVAIALAMLVAALLVSLWIERSRFGLSLTAIKQNEWAAEASGINALAWKMKAIMLSGAIAGAAGGFYAVVLLVVTPLTVFGILTSAQALIVTLFGGVATMWGPVVGAIILIPLAEILQAELGDRIPGINGVVFGAAIVLVILAAPEGIVPKLRDAALRGRQAGAARAPVAELPVAAAARRSAGDEVLLRVSGLSKSFGGLRAVQEVSFEVRKGEVFGIIGPNGAGKTTLFNLLNGFIRPDAGEILFQARPLARLKPSAICALGVGRTFQVMRPFPRMSVLDNVVVGAFVAEPDDRRALAAAHEALERVGLSAQADAVAGGLTTLELRLMELARAIASRPRLLLSDEPLAGLGAQEIDRLLATLGALAGAGLTIAIIEHTMKAMVRLADRLLVLDHGAVIASGRPQEVTGDAKVIEAYLGKRWAARAAN